MSGKELMNIVVLTLVLLCVAIITIPIIIYIIEFGVVLPNKPEVWGQFSDFMNLFVGLVNVIVTGSVAWFLYDLQSKSEAEIRRNEEVQLEIEKIFYLQSIFGRVLKISNRLLEYLNYLIQEFDNKPVKLPMLRRIPTVEIEILTDKVNRNDYYYTYKRVLKENNFFELFSVFDTIYGNYLEIIRSEISFAESDYKRMLENKNILQDLISELRSHLVRMKNDNMTDTEEYRIFNLVMHDHQIVIEKDPSDLFSMREVVYNPLLEYLVRKTGKYTTSEYSKLASLSSISNKSLTNVISGREMRKSNIVEMKNYLEEMLGEAKKQTDSIVEYNNK